MGINIRERFRERKYSYIKKREKEKENNLKELPEENQERNEKQKHESIFKIVIFSPLLFVGFIKKVVDSYKTNKDESMSEESLKIENIKLKKNTTELLKDKNIKLSKINKISIKSPNVNKINSSSTKNIIERPKQSLSKENSIPKRIGTSLGLYKKSKDNDKKEVSITPSGEQTPNSLEEKILAKLKKKLQTLKDSSELIESEAYLINKYSKDYNLLENAEEIEKEVEELLDKVEKIQKEYQILKDKHLIEDPSLLEDSFLIDDIIAYRNQISKENILTIPNKLKLLESYVYLYEKVDKLENENEKLKSKSEERVKELSERDSSYKEARTKMTDLEEINSHCNELIDKQNKYLEGICSKVTKIDEKKYTKYKLKGFSDVLSSSVRYIGLLTLTPLRGLIPSIAVRTMATRKLVQNMINNLKYEKQEEIIFLAENFATEINNKLYDIKSVENEVDLALEDVKKLKEEFHNYFFKYNLKDYEITYRKIENIEETIVNNKTKINLIKNQLTKSKDLNQTTLKKVKKLNS